MLAQVADTIEKAHEAAASSGGIGAIGIDVKALLFQLIKFAILFWVLKLVAYKPILGVLEARRKRIDESLQTAAAMERAEEALQHKQEELIAKARSEAETILASSRSEASEIVRKAEESARIKSEQLLSDARAKIIQDTETARKALKQEVKELVVLATAQIIEEKLDAKKDEALISKALKSVKEAV